MFLSHDEGPNGESFDKDNNWFEMLIELETKLMMTYKDSD